MNNVAPINEKLPVLEGKSNYLSGSFLRWIKDLWFVVNKSVVYDNLGNIAYNGATIPSDLHQDFTYEFFGDKQVTMRGKGSGIGTIPQIYTSCNCYFKKSAVWGLIDSAVDATIFYQVQSGFSFCYIASGTADGGFTSTPYKYFHQSYPTGNVNIKTGATYSATLL